MEGKKFDALKTRFDLVDPNYVRGIATVLTGGAAKYGDDNWQGLENGVARYTAAMHRHINAWQSTERTDQESGLHHLLHAATNIMFLLYLENNVDGKSTELPRHARRTDQNDGEPVSSGQDRNDLNADKENTALRSGLNHAIKVFNSSAAPERDRACLYDVLNLLGLTEFASSVDATQSGEFYEQ